MLAILEPPCLTFASRGGRGISPKEKFGNEKKSKFKFLRVYSIFGLVICLRTLVPISFQLRGLS